MIARIALVASMLAAVAPPQEAGKPVAPAAPAAATAPTKTLARPNFIFIQAEATGWSSTSVDMDGQPPSFARPAGLTPNLEKLAADGMRFTDFYVTAPRCTPCTSSTARRTCQCARTASRPRRRS